MNKGCKFRIYPTKEQQRILTRFFGCRRYIWNHYLEKINKHYEKTGEFLGFEKCSKDFTQLKKELEWLNEPAYPQTTYCLKQLNQAFKDFFKKGKEKPKFKSKSDRQSFTNQKNKNRKNVRIEGNRVIIPKIGGIRFRGKQQVNGRILSVTVSQEPSGKYYASLTYEDVEFEQLPKTNKEVGIDVGIISYAIFSDGHIEENRYFLDKYQDRISKLQKDFNRKEKGSNNREKARKKLAKAREKVRFQRTNYLHNLTKWIVTNYDIICVEDLSIKDMLEKNDDHSLNRHISDVSWYEFKRQLIYKAEWYGKKVVVVGKYYPSSQICNVCGHRDGKKTLDIRQWRCPKCGSELDRDLNAAINILTEGKRILNDIDNPYETGVCLT